MQDYIDRLLANQTVKEARALACGRIATGGVMVHLAAIFLVNGNKDLVIE